MQVTKMHSFCLEMYQKRTTKSFSGRAPSGHAVELTVLPARSPLTGFRGGKKEDSRRRRKIQWRDKESVKKSRASVAVSA